MMPQDHILALFVLIFAGLTGIALIYAPLVGRQLPRWATWTGGVVALLVVAFALTEISGLGCASACDQWVRRQRSARTAIL